MDTVDLALRLAVATLVGAALGVNRDLHGKAIGVKTLGLVGLGSALAVVAVAGTDPNPVSRVVQGLVTGIGFLGAGAIIRTQEGQRVHGLTTAACVWLAACLGAACGGGHWSAVLISVPLIFLVLVCGEPVERAFHRYWGEPRDQ